MVRDAIERRFEIIGEAAGQLSDETRALAPNVPWLAIKGMRNIVSHEYFRMDWRYVVEVLESDDLVVLRTSCESLRSRLEALEGTDSRETFRAHTVDGEGPRPGIDLDHNAELLDLTDERHPER
jgi:uncharacterized protein with HEPN domain